MVGRSCPAAGLREADSVPKVFLNENLTRVNRELFWKARSRAGEQNYKCVWVKREKIYARKSEGASLIRPSCAGDRKHSVDSFLFEFSVFLTSLRARLLLTFPVPTDLSFFM